MMVETDTAVEYRPIPGFPNYEIGSDGVPYSCWPGAPRTPLKSRLIRGYPAFDLRRGGKKFTLKVHRVVMLAFVGPCPEGQEVLHGDGDPTNPRLGNLRYGTKRENAADRDRHGTHGRGERSGRAKISNADAAYIRYLKDGGWKLRELEDRYGITKASLSYIINRKTFTEVPDYVPAEGEVCPAPGGPGFAGQLSAA
jgi:hypothetical protein